MKFNTRAFWLAGMFAVVFLAVSIIGYEYRVNLMELTINKYGGHTMEERAKKVVEKKKGEIVPGLDKKLLASPNQEMLAKGKQIYDVNCFSCHGLSGKGDGPAAIALNPKPRNFFEKDNWTFGNKVNQIFRAITEGIPGTGMVGFDYMPPNDRLALTHYVRSFHGNLPKDTKAELDIFDNKYGLTKGTVEPNTIPVNMAADFILNENQAHINKTIKTVELILSDKSKESQIFQSYLLNTGKAVNTLQRSENWKTNQDEFIKFVSGNLINNGFKVKLSSANDEEIAILYNYALKITS